MVARAGWPVVSSTAVVSLMPTRRVEVAANAMDAPGSHPSVLDPPPNVAVPVPAAMQTRPMNWYSCKVVVRVTSPGDGMMLLLGANVGTHSLVVSAVIAIRFYS